MKNEIKYEWDIEEIDEHGDIIDHNHADRLGDLDLTELKDANKRLVLIRDEGNQNDGLQERYWAYPINGVLPEYFSDAMGEVQIKVPKYLCEEYSIVTIRIF